MLTKELCLLSLLAILACSPTAKNRAPTTRQHVKPAALRWLPNTATPPGASVASVFGKAAEPGNYVFRLKFPANYVVPPHSHPDDRVYTVLDGMWYIGVGKAYHESLADSYPAGSVYLLPANTPHFHVTFDQGTMVQVSGEGPTATVYVDPADDPRTNRK